MFTRLTVTVTDHYRCTLPRESTLLTYILTLDVAIVTKNDTFPADILFFLFFLPRSLTPSSIGSYRTRFLHYFAVNFFCFLAASFQGWFAISFFSLASVLTCVCDHICVWVWSFESLRDATMEKHLSPACRINFLINRSFYEISFYSRNFGFLSVLRQLGWF